MIDPYPVFKPAWLTSEKTKTLLAAFPDFENTLKFVGGGVRDALLGMHVTDIDIATQYTPDQVLDFLKQAKINTIPIGYDHGTILAVIDGQGYEITTLRRDIETDGRHAKVEYTQDWYEDARRRDFTINALYLSSKGELYDPWNGVQDLQERHLRFIGNPVERIGEDGLRILRYFRFYARFGKQTPNNETFNALKSCAHMIERLSVERVWSELQKLLSHRTPDAALSLMDQTGLLSKIFRSPFDIDFFQHATDLLNDHNFDGVHALLRVFILTGFGEETLQFAHHYRLSTKEKKFLNALSRLGRDKELSRSVVCYYDGPTLYLAALFIAVLRGEINISVFKKDLMMLAQWEKPRFPITADDLKKRGYIPGKEFGDLLRKLELEWVKSDFALSRATLLSTLESR